MCSLFYVFLSRRWWLAFILLGVSFVAFGLVTLNLLRVFEAAWAFLHDHGTDAIADGVLWQFVELIFSGYLAAAFYVLFKVCEKVLVERFCSKKES